MAELAHRLGLPFGIKRSRDGSTVVPATTKPTGLINASSVAEALTAIAPIADPVARYR
ncbi:hypothetical protein [Streptomyces prunicolor]